MNKDFSQSKLLSFTEEKQLKILHQLASFIETQQHELNSSHFEKLRKYHSFLEASPHKFIQKINKEFFKVKALDRTFQYYLMHLERFLGMSQKEYHFLIQQNDSLEKQSSRFPIICVCDSIRSAYNIGAFFRNAECFAIEKVILTGLSPSPENQLVQKTAMGCDKLVNWEYKSDAVDAVKKLKEEGYYIIGIETAKAATPLDKVKYESKKLACLFGNEQFGLSLELLQECDVLSNIKLFGSKNSLNVANTQAIVLNELTRNKVI